MYSFGALPWKQSHMTEAEQPTLESVLSGQRVVAVAAGSFHSGAVTEDGGVHMWGENGSGQCGTSGLSTIPNPTPVALLDADASPPQTVPVLELACGAQHTLALSAQREVWAWGSGRQLGLNTTVSPVWKPQKVEQLAGRYVLQVACGAAHSLALVRCLGPQDVQRPPVDKCRQCNQLLYTMTDKEDHVIISDGHYCPLGVELTEDEGLKTSPSEPALPSHTPLSECPPPAKDADPSSDPILNPDASRGLPASDSDPSPQSKGGAGVGVKSSPYPDEKAVKDYLKRLSDNTQAEQAAKGGLHALLVSRQTGGEPCQSDRKSHGREFSNRK